MAITNSIQNRIKDLLNGRSVKSKVFRRLYDKNPDIQQYFDLDDKFKTRYNEFLKAYEEAAKEIPEEERATSRKRFEFDNMQFQISTGQKAATDSLNFRQIKTINKKLFPELQEGYEFGHKNISILRSVISLTLQAMSLKDPRRKALLGLLSIVKDIDSLDKEMGSIGQSKDLLLHNLRETAGKGMDLTATWTKDVNIISGLEGSIEIEAELKDLNQYKGKLSGWVGQVFAQIIRKEEEVIEEFFGDIDIVNLKGSPTMLQDLEKSLVEQLDPSKKVTKKKTSTKTSQKAKGRKSSKPQKAKLRQPSRRRQTNTKGIASQPLQLIGILNKKLPDTVRKNMRAPALENRTGRFAESVQVTDILQTPQGFPSIGYTYQRNPYEVFEMGSAGNWATPDRDPRKLIDKSIREVAAQFALGRFYTRRE